MVVDRTSVPAYVQASGPGALAVRPLRILQVNSLLSGGGADNQTLELCAGLAALGQEVTLVVPEGSRWEPLARGIDGVRVVSLPGRASRPLGVARALATLVRSLDADVVHAHQGRDYWPAVFAARTSGRGTRAVVTRHLMKRPRALSRWLLLRTAEVIAVSRAVEEVLRRDLSGPTRRLHLVYGGIETGRFAPVPADVRRTLRSGFGWSDRSIVFGVVGAFNHPRGKGQMEFLEAARQVHAAVPETRFAIVGSGSMEADLRARIRASSLDGIATMVPFTDDVAGVMNALDVVVHPALGTEALGVVLWEALANGKPVIASWLDGIPEAFEEGRHGVLVPPEDVSALARAMEGMARDPQARRALGEAGRAHVLARFTRAESAGQVLALYRRICVGRL